MRKTRAKLPGEIADIQVSFDLGPSRLFMSSLVVPCDALGGVSGDLLSVFAGEEKGAYFMKPGTSSSLRSL
ncbi:hypothetical protein [Pseudomonas tussilaginis]|uniref:hypothetical protein n=1 Tax=Pseudomonas sp. 5 TaxID=1619949 RepID=UPI000A53C26A|nr:hypothetical protein [Pseudomonas sp. 5]